MGFKGRAVTLVWNGITIAKMRTKSVSINNEPIDITGDTDDGWRALLDEAGERQINISASGVVINDDLKMASLRNDVGAAALMVWPDGSGISGSFFMASYSENGEYNGAIMFEAEFQSQGVVLHDSATK